MFAIREQTQKEFQQLDVLKLIEVGVDYVEELQPAGQCVMFVIIQLLSSNSNGRLKTLAVNRLKPSPAINVLR